MNIFGYTFTDNENDDVVQYEALKTAKCDQVYSDTQNKRNQRDALLNEIIQPGGTLIIWRLDRLVDSVAELQKLLAIIDAKHVTLITIQEKISHSLSNDKLNELVSVMAKIESELI